MYPLCSFSYLFIKIYFHLSPQKFMQNPIYLTKTFFLYVINLLENLNYPMFVPSNLFSASFLPSTKKLQHIASHFRNWRDTLFYNRRQIIKNSNNTLPFFPKSLLMERHFRTVSEDPISNENVIKLKYICSKEPGIP